MRRPKLPIPTISLPSTSDVELLTDDRAPDVIFVDPPTHIEPLRREDEFATESIFHRSRRTRSSDPWNVLVDDRNSSDTRELYNVFAKDYEEYMRSKNYQAPQILARYIGEQLGLQPQQTILDLGCGTGLAGETLSQMYGFAHIEGADISEEMVDILKRQRSSYTECSLVNITPTTQFSFRCSKYDCVLMCGSLLPGHVSPQSLPHIAQQLINPGGFLIWISPSLLNLGFISLDYDEYQFMQILEELCASVGMRHIERAAVDNFMAGISGEMFCLQKL